MEPIIIACAAADGPLTKGNVRAGHRCVLCHTPLQVSPEGRAQITAGGIPVCNPCGRRLIEQGAQFGGMNSTAKQRLAEEPRMETWFDDVLGRKPQS